jgi:hypothetical protein
MVAFSSQGDRIALTQIEQMVDGQYRKLGYYDTQADNLTWFNREEWYGENKNKVSMINCGGHKSGLNRNNLIYDYFCVLFTPYRYHKIVQ